MLSFPFPFLAESSGPLIFLVKCSSLVVSSIPSKKSLRSGSSEFIQKKVFQGPKLANKFLTIHSLLRVNLTFFSFFFWVSLGQTKSIFFKKKSSFVFRVRWLALQTSHIAVIWMKIRWWTSKLFFDYFPICFLNFFFKEKFQNFQMKRRMAWSTYLIHCRVPPPHVFVPSQHFLNQQGPRFLQFD